VLSPLVALLPVVLFLAALSLMDTFRLVRLPAIGAAILYGGAAAGVSLAFNEWLLRGLHVPAPLVRQYIAPAAEETAKALPIAVLIASARVAFLVDAAVLGFAVGTGFALVENLWYLGSLGGASAALWIVRGFGTAILQGGTTSIVAIVARVVADREPGRPVLATAPGLAAAVAIHSAFNHRWLPPMAETLLLLIALPLLVVFVFERSERATREWIGGGLDLDLLLHDLLQSPDFASTRFGRYLDVLRARLPGTVVADMYCLLRLEIELSIEAKALLLAREAGLELPASADLEPALAERRCLEASIGTAGLLALEPLRVTGHRDRWHRHVLRVRSGRSNV
jgi:protease PrsW